MKASGFFYEIGYSGYRGQFNSVNEIDSVSITRGYLPTIQIPQLVSLKAHSSMSVVFVWVENKNNPFEGYRVKTTQGLKRS